MRFPSAVKRFGAPSRHARHSWVQRLTVVGLVICAFACFTASVSFGAAQWVLAHRKLTDITTTTSPSAQAPVQGADQPIVVTPEGTIPPDAPPAEIVLAEPAAANFLIVGADNNDCAGQNDPTVGNRSSLGERSDTIMIWRANPKTNQLAVLSFPRDLYVNLPGGRKGRINQAFERNNPRRLIETIDQNFGVPVDHYIQVDFCAFREMVNAIGGVGVPFEYPARDLSGDKKYSSGLNITQTGCVNLDGDTALAYVRSRHYQYQDDSGKWQRDESADFGRIARQQDFLRRVVSKVIGKGLYSPNVAGGLISTNQKYVVTDEGLTVDIMLQFASTMKSLDPAAIQTYRIDSYSQQVGSALVEIPRVSSDNMQAILAVFRGEAMLADAPDQVIASSTSVPRSSSSSTTTTTSTSSESSTPTTTTSTTTTSTPTATQKPTPGASTTTAGPTGATTTTLPAVAPESNTRGKVPDPNIVCP